MVANQDKTAPIGRSEIVQIVNKSDSHSEKSVLVTRVLKYLNEKRDAYNGVISSMIYMIETNDVDLIELIKKGLNQYVATHPMRYGGKIFITRCLPRLISETPQFVADYFSELVLNSHEDWKNRMSNFSGVLKIKITALKAIGQAEDKMREKLTSFTSQQVEAICDEAVIKGDNETKIDTLHILLSTSITTKVLVDRELDIFLKIYKDALSFQEPALRQKFLAITGKLLKRMKDSIRVVWRDDEKFSESARTDITRRYMIFLETLIDFCLDNLYSSKYFGSFIVTMTTLKYVIEYITLNDTNLQIAQFFHQKRFHDSILNCLVLDTFEDNKILALNLLFSLQQNGHTIPDRSLDLFEKIAYKLVSSVNPAHSLTCQYIFKLIIGYEQIKSSEQKNKIVYKHLNKLISSVEDGIRQMKEDFFLALKRNAIYPKLTCTRALLNEINIKDLESDRRDWQSLSERIVKASIEASQSVSSIVCNMNPETMGHLPMDQEPIDVDTLSKNLDRSVNISDSCLNTISSQYLLITGWKTIKECSLSMGAMCTKLWWPVSANLGEPILQSSSIISIIEFFKHYLRNLRHRGAFEQAYTGFMKVTKRIWLDEHFKNILIAILNEILDDFQSEQSLLCSEKVINLKRQVTRRSAGLPFLVQAIAASEDKKDSKVLRYIIDALIRVMQCDKAETYQKIHCLNILKALINDFNLAEKVVPYLGQVFTITIEAFKSEDFPIRNCANMLMRALVDRTFGTSRLRDEIHRRNTLSYEKFFSDYPDLHAKLEQCLHDGLRDKRCLASVHGAFIILSHLRPSVNASDKYSIDKMAGPFIEPALRLALTCPDFKLRELSAKMVVQLEIQQRSELAYSKFKLFDDYQALILSKDWIEQIKIESNTMHGLLCMLRHWVEHCDMITSTEHQNQLFYLVDTIVRIVLKVNNQDRTNFLRLSAVSLCESCCLVDKVSKFMLNQDWLPQELLSYRKGKPILYEPLVGMENLAFRSISLSLTTPKYSDDFAKSRNLLKITIEVVKQPPNRVFSINLQASLIRFLRQFFSQDDNFIDRLVSNLDLDSTAAHITPIDRLNQRSEFDSEREIWLKYCEQPDLRRMIRDEIPDEYLNSMFALHEYEEFKLCQNEGFLKANSPRAIELLAFACKAWKRFNLEERCIWLREGETIMDKLKFLIDFIQNLPDCDIKCLVLLCASHLFVTQIHKIHATCDNFSEGQKADLVANEVRVVTRFSLILEELAECLHDRNIRGTCSEILTSALETLLACWCEPLKDTLVNISSALLKLCQDEDYEIREAISRSLVNSNHKHTSHNVTDASHSANYLDDMILCMTTSLLDPSEASDVSRCFELFTRMIFNHSKSSTIELSNDRESLYDKTIPNVFADHVTTIQNTLAAAKTFFVRATNPINLDSLKFSSNVLDELSASDLQIQMSHDVGDYSWRHKSEHSSRPCEGDCEGKNKRRVDNALTSIRQNLDYFNYSNMLIDTSFGCHESSLFKRLAFIKLLLESTDYDNKQLLAEIKDGLGIIMETSCATTILSKCYALFDQNKSM